MSTWPQSSFRYNERRWDENGGYGAASTSVDRESGTLDTWRPAKILHILLGSRSWNPLLATHDATHQMHEERVIPWSEPAICIHESTLSQPRSQQAHIELGGRDPIQNAPDLSMVGFATSLD
jgi:hypothetical protein